ncbi:MAG: DPP IV N-terminal domain-containing protein [Pseudomonadota bacterium]
MRIWWLAMLIGGAAMAAEPAPKALTLERVFASPDLNGAQPQSLKLSPDGTLLTSLRPRPDERTRFDLWAVDTRTGAERMLVDSKRVGTGAELSEAEKMQRERDRSLTGKTGIVAYDWTPDGKAILVPLDGDLYLADLAGKVRRLTATPAGELNPAVSPAGGFLSFVRDQNLFVQPLAGGEARRVTPDGAGTVHWGEAEFVADEEMDRHTGYWWAPGDTRIAVARYDEAPVGTVTRAAIGADGTRVFEQRYPAAGTPNVLIELWVMAPDGSARVKVDLGNERDIYLARVDWSPDGSALYVQRQDRAQTRLDLLRVDPATGRATSIFTERAAPNSWVNLSDNYRFLKDGSILWWSERDGFGHLYRFAKGRWTQLTKGRWVVSELTGVDEARGELFFTGKADGMLETHLYRQAMKPGAKPVRLTEPGWSNAATANGDASRLIVRRSNPGQPTQVYLADRDGKRLAWVNENRIVAGHPYYPYLAAHRPTEFGTIKAADGSDLHWQMITPVLEPGKRYPVFFQHYGGPTNQQVARDWEGALAQYWVSRGWIYFQIDNRGSANRGRAFLDQLYRAMGGVEVVDQLAGAKWLAKQPFVDADKIATYGWSYGGYLTLKMLEADRGIYAAGVAGAPVTRWELYDTHYTERYMGTPERDAAAYKRADAIADAAKIRAPLLVIHGMADDNVVLDHTTAFAARMQATNTPFEMMLYPGKTHAAARDVHVWTTIEAFLNRAVKDKPGAGK